MPEHFRLRFFEADFWDAFAVLGAYMEQGLEDFHTETTEVSPPEGVEASNGSNFWRFLRDILETLVLAIILFLAINAISARIRVDGSSMVPTLTNGQFVIVNRLTYKLGDPNHGDVIVFDYPRDPEQEYIKRIIGLPGDTIEMNSGHVYINGQIIDEPYIAADARNAGEWTVPGDHVFVLGDNRNNSQDSRNFGFVSMDSIIGKALVIYWPPTDWGIITHPEYGILDSSETLPESAYP
jgi:signal peptidase I